MCDKTNDESKALKPVDIIANKAIKEQYSYLFDSLLHLYSTMVIDKKNAEKIAKKHDQFVDYTPFYDTWLLSLLADQLGVEKDVIKFLADKHLKEHNERIEKMNLGSTKADMK